MVEKLTAVVVVEAIEPALPFWEALGYARVAEVPHGGGLGFVILSGPAGELMLQTRASVREDLGVGDPGLVLYVEVESLERARRSVEGCEVLIERRTTAYGATESWIRDPAGTVVGLAVH